MVDSLVEELGKTGVAERRACPSRRRAHDVDSTVDPAV